MISVGITRPNKQKKHNELESLVGGEPFVHLNGDEYDRFKDLVYIDSVNTIAISPATGEKGVLTALTLTYRMISNDDDFVSASINNAVGNVLPSVDNGNISQAIPSRRDAIAYALTMQYNRKGVLTNETKNASYTAFTPQFAGVSADADYSSYSEMSADLQKFIQSSASIGKASSPAGQYIWFVSTKNNALIQDINNFTQTTGPWGDGVSEFYRKSIVLTLSDGITTSTVYLYRSREVKTLVNFTYKIS